MYSSLVILIIASITEKDNKIGFLNAYTHLDSEYNHIQSSWYVATKNTYTYN